MIFYLHFILLTGGLSGCGVLLGVYFKTYSQVSDGEIGILLMLYPLMSTIIRPGFCALADRHQAHKAYLIGSLIVMIIGFLPFAILPFFETYCAEYRRLNFYLLAVTSLVGNGSLGVAWSLGEALAVNKSARTGVPFSRMRLMGTLSWGVYGLAIGQINEAPGWPKYVPTFIVMELSVALEALLVWLWHDSEFKMVDAVMAGADAPTVLHRTDSALHQVLSRQASLSIVSIDKHTSKKQQQQHAPAEESRNPQFELFKMIARTDVRLIKYLLLFGLFGFLISPINFVFMNLERLCENGAQCNFSQLAGLTLMSQALCESVGFFFMPYILKRVSKQLAYAIALLVMIMRYFFYSTSAFNDAHVTPYWSLLAEWGHGLSYSIYCSMIADLAFMFANQSRYFFSELRAKGYMCAGDDLSERRRLAEEESVKLALRATMQATLSVAGDGLGSGFGVLAAGFLVELFSFVTLWHVLTCLAAVLIALQQIIEITRTRWSDSYEPEVGSKLYEIQQCVRSDAAAAAAAATQADERQQQQDSAGSKC